MNKRTDYERKQRRKALVMFHLQTNNPIVKKANRQYYFLLGLEIGFIIAVLFWIGMGLFK